MGDQRRVVPDCHCLLMQVPCRHKTISIHTPGTLHEWLYYEPYTKISYLGIWLFRSFRDLDMFLFALYFDKFVKKTQRKYYNQGKCHCLELGGLYNQVNFAKSKEAMLFDS